MVKRFFLLPLLFAVLASPPALAKEPPHVVVSIAPLHSLVAGVMQGAATPELLVKGGASLHNHNLRPSQMRALHRANLIVWIGNGAEVFLRRPLANLKPKPQIITAIELPGLIRLPARSGGVWEHHLTHSAEETAQPEQVEHNDHDEHPTRPEQMDSHIWLDPINAGVITESIAEILTDIDPERAALYQGNAVQLMHRLKTLDSEIGRLVASALNKPYLVFHDAYQYFELRYGLNPLGSVTINPERKPGARRLHEIEKKLKESGAQCIFSEPQFPSSHLKAITGGGEYRVGELDPLGTDIPPGPDMYFSLMRRLANAFINCLDS